MGEFIQGWLDGRVTGGIANVTSGTLTASVSATGVVSGDIITVSPYMYSITTSQAFKGVEVTSVRADAFEITAIGSFGPIGTCPVAWTAIKMT